MYVVVQLELMKMLRKLAEAGKGIVTVMHDLPLAFTFSDQILLLHEGNVLRKAAPELVCRDDMIRQIFGVTLLPSEDAGAYSYQY
jgi:iron complex transport system ATP-binding protein